MRLYAVSPDHTGADPEGEDLDEWYTSLAAAKRAARACIKEMNENPRPEGGWVQGRVRITRYETRENLTVEWVTRALSGIGAWESVEQVAEYEMDPQAGVEADLVEALEQFGAPE